MRRTAVIATAATLALAAAGWTGYWLYAAAALRDGVSAWAAERRAQGLSASFSAIEVTGFPLRFQTTVRDPVLMRPTRPAKPGAEAASWAWRGSEVVATSRPWTPRQLQLSLSGTHEFTLPLDATAWTVFATARQALASVRLDPAGAPLSGVFETQELDLVSEDGSAAVTIARATVAGRAPPPGGDGPGSVTLELDFWGEGVDLATSPELPLGRRIDALEGTASLLGAWPAGLPALARAAALWRDGGGTVELRRLYVRWGPLEIEATGTLALDAEMQPMGALKATIRGFAETIDALVAAGMVRERDGNTAKVVLGLLARKAEDGGRDAVTVPVTVQGGRLYLGPVALLRMPKVRWG